MTKIASTYVIYEWSHNDDFVCQKVHGFCLRALNICTCKYTADDHFQRDDFVQKMRLFALIAGVLADDSPKGTFTNLSCLLV